MDGFCWFARRMVQKQFAVFAVDDRELQSNPVEPSSPLIVYANHPGWWDPIVAMLLCRELFPQRSYFAPIDAEALKKYKSFRKLGYFGIDMNSTKGAADFLRTANVILGLPDTSLWVTPEGRFTDPRDDQPEFMPGVAHLASRTNNVSCVPLAIEYAFVEEQQPFMLCRLGKAVQLPENHRPRGDPRQSKEVWHRHLEVELRNTQQMLAASVIRRDWSGFRVLLKSKRRLHGNGFG